jgi:hypothetical protein
LDLRTHPNTQDVFINWRDLSPFTCKPLWIKYKTYHI